MRQLRPLSDLNGAQNGREWRPQCRSYLRVGERADPEYVGAVTRRFLVRLWPLFPYTSPFTLNEWPRGATIHRSKCGENAPKRLGLSVKNLLPGPGESLFYGQIIIINQFGNMKALHPRFGTNFHFSILNKGRLAFVLVTFNPMISRFLSLARWGQAEEEICNLERPTPFHPIRLNWHEKELTFNAAKIRTKLHKFSQLWDDLNEIGKHPSHACLCLSLTFTSVNSPSNSFCRLKSSLRFTCGYTSTFTVIGQN